MTRPLGYQGPSAAGQPQAGGEPATAPMSGSTSTDAAAINMPPGHNEDMGENYGRPPEYPVYTVSDADNALPAPLVSPSGGEQGPVEQGMNDVNPQGPQPDPTVGAPAGLYQAPPGNVGNAAD